MQQGVEHLGFLSAAPWMTRLFGVEMGKELMPGDLILLDGPFGAGKTTFVQGLAVGAETSQRVTSPSYTLINEYRGRLPIFHVDLFRLNELDLEMEHALESCEQSDGVSVVEWPHLLPADLRQGALIIDMGVVGEEERTLVLHAEGSRWSSEVLESIIQAALRGRDDGVR